MLTYSEERSLVDDIKEGIEIALYREGHSAELVDDIKLNKLVYFANQEFDLGITYGWFKFGPAPVDVATNPTGDEFGPQLSPKPETDVIAANRSRVPSEERHHPSPVDYADFFTEFDEFEVMLETETKPYLRDFYERYAPEKYRDLYLSSIFLQLRIDEIPESVEFIGENSDIYSEVSELLNDLYKEILLIDTLSEVVEPFQYYKMVMKNVVAAANRKDSLEENSEQLIERIRDYFYNSTWYYVALLISKDTVTGENKDRLRSSIEDNLGQIRERHDVDLRKIEEHTRLVALMPRSRQRTIDSESGEVHSDSYSNDIPNLSDLSRESYKTIN